MSNTRKIGNTRKVSNTRILNILVVDDNEIHHIVISRHLKKLCKLQMNFSFAKDGVEAVEQCKKQSFDLIFMDYNMPKMKGDVATKEIRKIDTNCFIVTFSATTDCEVGFQGIFEGANARIDKPAKLIELKSILKQMKVNEEDLDLIESLQPNGNFEIRNRKSSLNTNDDVFFKVPEAKHEKDENDDVEPENEAGNCCKNNCTLL